MDILFIGMEARVEARAAEQKGIPMRLGKEGDAYAIMCWSPRKDAIWMFPGQVTH